MQCSHPAKKRQAGSAVGHPELSRQPLHPTLSPCQANRAARSLEETTGQEHILTADRTGQQAASCPPAQCPAVLSMAPAMGHTAQVTMTILRIGHGSWVRQNRESPASCLGTLASHGALRCLQAPPISIWPKLHGSVPMAFPHTQVILCTRTSLSMLTAQHHGAEPAQC